MIIETVLTIIFELILGVIDLMPKFPYIDYSDTVEFFRIISVINMFIDLKLFFSCLLVMLVSLNIELIWGYIEWVYKKIPGIN